MVMLDMRSAVERHSYAPGGRPQAKWVASSTAAGPKEGTRARLHAHPSLVGIFSTV